MVNIELKVERVCDIHSLEAIREEWTALLQESETKTVELTYEWQMTYWKYFNADAELFVLIIKEAGNIAAIAPLKLTRMKVSGWNARCLDLIAAAESNYQDFIIGRNSEDILACVVDYLLNNSRFWDVLRLKHIPEASTTTGFLRKRFAGYPLRKVVTFEKCMFLEMGGTDADYKQEQKKNDKSRKDLANKIKRLERDLGNVSLRHSSTPEQLKADMSMFFDLHSKRWNRTETPSMFNEHRYREFYLDAARQLISRNQIELSTLMAGGVQLAQALFFTSGKKVVGQLIAYDIDYLKYSPEFVLLELCVNELISNGAEIIDFGSYNPYKERWTNRLKNRVDFQIYPKRFWPGCMYVMAIVNNTLLYCLRRSAILLHTAKYVRRKVRSLRRSHSWPSAE